MGDSMYFVPFGSKVSSPGAKVHPKCLYHTLCHKFHPLNELRNQIKTKKIKNEKGTLFVENRETES